MVPSRPREAARAGYPRGTVRWLVVCSLVASSGSAFSVGPRLPARDTRARSVESLPPAHFIDSARVHIHKQRLRHARRTYELGLSRFGTSPEVASDMFLRAALLEQRANNQTGARELFKHGARACPHGARLFCSGASSRTSTGTAPASRALLCGTRSETGPSLRAAVVALQDGSRQCPLVVAQPQAAALMSRASSAAGRVLRSGRLWGSTAHVHREQQGKVSGTATRWALRSLDIGTCTACIMGKPRAPPSGGLDRSREAAPRG